MAFNYLIPMLEVENMDETIEFYENILDFVCVKRSQNAWSLMQKDEVAIMFSDRFFKEEHPNTFMTGSLYIYSDNVDVLWQILKNKVNIAYPLDNFEPGKREFAIFDNNGYRIQFGQDLNTN
ncbi:VOC family protein [Formosa maritima]|uniref:Bleomycin resistance family protein n=1 Tax=Formosa maritima TaxID=2592046 RepID=A0A5D0GBQ2_9FLAO|nr:VOC family protein [Formosa maritima]TYA55202.1 bleomycin resistance family protein [Formosa maritima]